MKRRDFTFMRMLSLAICVPMLSLCMVACDEDEVKEMDTPCGQAGHVHAVDLGLSVKWACCNIGANAPEEYGGYYAWGDPEEKESCIWDNYKW